MNALTWIRTLPTEAVEADGVAAAQAGRHRVALYAVDGAFYATSDLCTHGLASLAEGYLDGFLIECPLHQGSFDIRTGAAASAPCSEPVQSFPVRIEDGHVLVGVPAE